MPSTEYVLAAALLALARLPLVSALMATPNSPCFTTCAESSDSAAANGVSSINGTEITCTDSDFQSKAVGQRYQQCLSCLQGSTFSFDGQYDQGWFLYNLRYSFDYCIFGYPNATGIGSNPCTTSNACGPLVSLLENELVDPNPTQPYDYCGAQGSTTFSGQIDQCLQCVQAEQSYTYLSNFLVALQAGCQQQPAFGVTIGLNESVFSLTTVQIVQPTPTGGAATVKAKNANTIHIVLIAIGGLLFSLLAGACGYMQIRKRKNRAARKARVRASMALPYKMKASSPSVRSVSSLSQHSSMGRDMMGREMEKYGEDRGRGPVVGPGAALHSNPVNTAPSWPKNASTNKPTRLTTITTTAMPCPPPVHASPHRGSPDIGRMTPTSTTSMRSNAPLLQTQPFQPYVPAEHYPSASPIPGQAPFSSTTFVPGLALTTNSAAPSPFAGQSSVHAMSDSGSIWEGQSMRGSARDLVSSRRANGNPYAVSSDGRPVQTSFPPPPNR